MKKLIRATAAIAIMFAGTGSALAQNWPNKPIRMVVPYTPGGYTDLMARLVGQKVSEALGQTIVFENKPGANARSEPTLSPRPRLMATRSER